MFNYCIGIFLGTWFLLSVLWQFKFSFLKPIQKFDFLQLLPNWTFFAPNPGTSDYHLIYKTDCCGEEENWKEIPIIQNRSLVHFFLNVEKRKLKTLIDCIHGMVSVNNNNILFKLTDEASTKSLCISVSYMLLLNAVENEIRKGGVTKETDFQFAIVESYGFIPKNEPHVIITSTIHTI